jgi:hypothetical protein
MKARDKQDFAQKWTGLVTVISGESQAKLTSVQKAKDGKIKLFPNETDTLKVKLSDLPKDAKRVIKANMKDAKRFRVRLSEDGDEIETVTPASGVFPASKFIGLGPKDKDGNWKPMIHRVYNEGTAKENSHDEFFARYEITSGVFKGVELPAYYMHYKFEEIPEGEEDGGFTQYNTADTPQASQLHKLQNWASVHGNILDEPIRWPDDGDIRSEIEERAMDKDIPVTLVFEDGYIKSIQPDDNYEDEEEESDETFDEKFPVKDDEVEEIPAKKDILQDTMKGKSSSTSKSKKPPKVSDDEEL